MKGKRLDGNQSGIWLGVARILLQVDLEGHSQWFREAQNKREALNAKADFADKVETLMCQHGFELVYWAGDGGMYACDPSKLPSYDRAVDAARSVGREFQRWRDKKKNRERLRIRISIHCGFPVYVHSKPGYWTSVHLNAFAKHERDIGIAGAIAITDAIRENLDPRLAKEFPDSTRRQVLVESVPGEPALIRHVYYLPIEGENTKLRESYSSFGAWMKQICNEIGLPWSTDVGPHSAIRAVVGDAIVLQFSPGRDATTVVDLRRRGPVKCELTASELAMLAQAASELHRKSLKRGLQDEQKVSPQRVIFPLTDFPCMTIEWYLERWSRARAFHKQLTENAALWGRLARSAADVQSKGLPFPGILAVHIIARLAEESETPYVLLCQRNERGYEDTYHEGLWSCSIEEQVRPGETIERCARRGIAEELLGSEASEHIGISIAALFLERPILNLTLLAIADIPLSYGEVVERWRQDAPDKDEHRQIVALPLQRDTVVACGKHGGLPERVRANCLVIHRAIFGSTTRWEFHPTSLFRLATALWLQDGG